MLPALHLFAAVALLGQVGAGADEDDEPRVAVEIEVLPPRGADLASLEAEFLRLPLAENGAGWPLRRSGDVFHGAVPEGLYLFRALGAGIQAIARVVEVPEGGRRRVKVRVPAFAASNSGPGRPTVCERPLGVPWGISALVTPRTGAPFEIELFDLPATVRVPRLGALSRMQVKGSLEFEAYAPGIPWVVGRSVSVGHGLVHLGTGTRVWPVAASGGKVIASVESNGALFGPFTLDCGALSAQVEESARDEPALDEEGPWWWLDPPPDDEDDGLARPLKRRLWTRPDRTAASVEVVLLDESRPWTFARELERRGRWVKLAWKVERVRLTGWIPLSDLHPDHPARELGVGGLCCGGPHRSCHRGFGLALGSSPPRIYQGPARIAKGTLVEAAEPGSRWATVREADGFEILHFEGEEWAELREIPGLRLPSCGRDTARVPFSAVTLPDGAVYRGPR